MMRSKILLVSLLIATNSWGLPFNDDMVNSQPGPGKFVRPTPASSVELHSNAALISKEAAEAVTNPVPSSDLSIKRGKRLFATNCEPCHGKISKTNWVPGKVVMGAPNLADPTYHTRTDGQIYRVINFGNLIMPAVGWKLSAAEAWDVVNYVRSIQKD